VAWFASSFLNREASGTSAVAKRVIQEIISEYEDEIEVTLIFKDSKDSGFARNDPILSKANHVVLPKVFGKKLAGVRSYMKYSLQKPRRFDVVHFSVPRMYPFFWFFPADTFISTFHGAGDISASRDKYIVTRELYNLIARFSWHHLDKIIVDSSHAVSEIEKHYGIPESKQLVILPGADEFWNLDSVDLRDEFNGKTIICIVGRWQKYKNVHNALRAIAAIKHLTPNIHVVLVGKPLYDGKYLVEEELRKFSSKEYTHFEFLEQGQLKRLYQISQLVIHPSINEGFGLPAFEAFTEGAPLLVHFDTPAAEYLGKSAGVISTNLLDLESTQEALLIALKYESQDRHYRRQQVEDLGAVWSKTVEGYVALYRKV